jgi:hypothetical protein
MPDYIGQAKGNIFLSALGSFWTQIFEQKDLIATVLHGSSMNIADLYFRLCELMLGSALKDVPIFSRQTWSQLVWLRSNINVGTDQFYQYGDPLAYGDEDVYYGSVWPSSQTALRLPQDLENIGSFICNKIYNPSLVLVAGRDYLIRNQVIIFSSDIFENGLVPTRNIYDIDGNIIDQEISLWAPKVYVDKEDLYNKYGSLIGLKGKSSQEYKSLLLTTLALYTAGPKTRYVEGFLNAVFDLPIALDDEEIKYVITEGDETKVYTKKNLYVLDSTQSLVPLYPGKQLKVFDPFYEIVTIIQNRDHPFWLNNRNFLTLPKKLLSGDYQSPLFVQRAKVEYNIKIGATAVMPVKGTFSESLQTLFENYPLKIGMPGFKIGASKCGFDALNYIADQVKNNLFFILISSPKVKATNMTAGVTRLFKSVIPAFCSYIFMTELQDLQEEYNVIDSIEEDVAIYEGHTKLEELSLNKDIMDGHYGIVKIGQAVIGPLFIIGETKFNAGPMIIDN